MSDVEKRSFSVPRLNGRKSHLQTNMAANVMWCLRQKTGETFFQLLCGEEYTVGRKDVQIIVDRDASVSRSHALLTVSTVPHDRIDDVSFVPLLRLKDLGSKYGTRLNNTRLAANEETVVQNGDTVTFGQLGSSFTVHYEHPMVITSSCLQPDEKEKLKESAAKLGGRVMPEWSDACTHLVMSSIRLTVKTTSALVAAKPVVKPTFLYDTVGRLRSKNWTDLNPSDYIPEISEENLTIRKAELDRNPARKTLFSGKVFYFLDKSQHAKLAPLLVSGGGRVELAKDPNKPQPVYLEENSCVFKPSHGIPDHPVCKFLTKNKLRAIPESDVALSVAHCSTHRYCNPRSTAVVALWGNSHTLSSQSQAFSPGEVYVPNTEDDSEVDCWGKKVALTARTIPESRQLSVTPASSRLEDVPSTSTTATTLNGGHRNTLAATNEEPSLKITSADPNLESPSQKSPSRLSLSQKRSSRLSLRSPSKSPSRSPAELSSGHGLRSARRLRMTSDSPPKPCPGSPLQSLSVVSASPVAERTVLCISRRSRSQTSNILTKSTSKTACEVTAKSSSKSPSKFPSRSSSRFPSKSPPKLRSNSPSKPSTSNTSNISTRSASKSPSKTRGASKALSRVTSKSPSKSPSKIRKKDAAGSLPLELYFSPCKKRRGATGTTAEPATKLLRLAEAGDTANIKAEDDREEIKDEPTTPPAAKPELWFSEDAMDMAPHEMNGVEDSILGSGSRLELAERMPSCELEETDWARKGGLNPALATAAVVAGTDELSDEAERSMVVVEFENLVLANSSRRNETILVNADSGPNFKRFRKVNKDQRRGLPKIIGGPDLLVYVPNQPEEVYSDEDPASQNHADLFNYNPPDPKRRRQ